MKKKSKRKKISEGLLLNELPKDLKYAVFREGRSKHVIIAANLTAEK